MRILLWPAYFFHFAIGLSCGDFKRGVVVTSSRFEQMHLSTSLIECRSLCEASATGSHNDGCGYSSSSGTCTYYGGPVQSIEAADSSTYFAWCKSSFQYLVGSTPSIGCSSSSNFISEGWWCNGLALDSATNALDCQKRCCNDPSCDAWQMVAGQCWVGPQSQCTQGSELVPEEGGIVQRQVYQTINFYPEADAMVAHDHSNLDCNYGKSNKMVVGANSTESVFRALVRFPVTLPAGFQVTEALLSAQTLYWGGRQVVSDVTVNVHEVKKSWLEGSGGPEITDGGLAVIWQSPAATQTIEDSMQSQGFAFHVTAAHSLDNVMVEMSGTWVHGEWVAELLTHPSGQTFDVLYNSLTPIATAAAEPAGNWARFNFDVQLVPDMPYVMLVSFIMADKHSYLVSQDVLFPSYPVVSMEPRVCGDTNSGSPSGLVQKDLTSLHVRFAFVLAKVAAMCGAADGVTGHDRAPGLPWAQPGVGLNGIDAGAEVVATETKHLTALSPGTVTSWSLDTDGGFAYTAPSIWMDPENPDLANSYYPQDPEFFQYSRFAFDVASAVRKWYADPTVNNGLMLANAIDQPTGLALGQSTQLPTFPALSSREGILPPTLQVTLMAQDSTAATCPCGPFFIDPWTLNVFVTRDLGSPTQRRSADFQGACAVGGNVWVDSFSVNDQHRHTQQNIALYSGGDVNFIGGQVYSGGMAVAGNVVLAETGVDGVVLSGGSVSGTGLITKSVTASGVVTFPPGNVLGTVQSGVAYRPPLDLVGVAAYFQCYSAALAMMPDSHATLYYEQNGGIIDVQLTAATRAVITIPATSFIAAWQIVLWGPTAGQTQQGAYEVDPNAELIINVPDETVEIHGLSWVYIGLARGKLILNLPNAKHLHISGATHEAIIMAPHATVVFPYGRINGQLICDTLTGGNGQVDDEVTNNVTREFASCTSQQCSCDDGIRNGREQGVDCGDPDCGCPPCGNCTCDDFPMDPWTFNVVVMGDVGSAQRPRGADIEGIAAALGTVYYKAISINTENVAGAQAVAQYVGGHCHWNGGQVFNGALEVHGTAYLHSVGCDGSVFAGANVAGQGGGHIVGNVEAGGDCLWCSMAGSTVGGSVEIGVPFQPSMDLPKLETYFVCASNQLAQRVNTPTAGAFMTNEYGHLSVVCVPGQRNFVTILGGQLLSAWKISLYGTTNTELIINVPDTNVVLGYLHWDYQGIPKGNVILNMPFATTLHVSSGPHEVVFLAPWAVMEFSQGLIVGNLIVGTLLGGNGQVHDGLRNRLSLPCVGEVCSCPDLRDLSCRPCIPGQDKMCSSIVQEIALCEACNGKYGAHCQPFQCFCPAGVADETGDQPGGGFNTCRPCLSDEVGCTHAGVATIEWCQHTCTDGQYTGTCAPSHCHCPIGNPSVPITDPQIPGTGFPAGAPAFLEPCVAVGGGSQAHCNQQCLVGAFYSSTCFETECDCPLGAAPSCRACAGPGCAGTATDQWCEQNCLASLYYGGACLPQFCTCPVGHASVVIEGLTADNPTLSLAALIAGLMEMTGASAIDVVRILPATGDGGLSGRRTVTTATGFKVALRLKPGSDARADPRHSMKRLQTMIHALNDKIGQQLTFGESKITLSSVNGPDFSPGLGNGRGIDNGPNPDPSQPGDESTDDSTPPIDGQVPDEEESGLSTGLLIAIPLLAVFVGGGALATGGWLLYRRRQRAVRSDEAFFEMAAGPTAASDQLEAGSQQTPVIQVTDEPQPLSPPPSAADAGATDPFPAAPSKK